VATSGTTTNIIPDGPKQSLDAARQREDPQKKFAQSGIHWEAGILRRRHEPSLDERREHALVAKVINEGGYRASRTAHGLPASRPWSASCRKHQR